MRAARTPYCGQSSPSPTYRRRARKREPERRGGFFRPLRQSVESIFDTLKGQLDLERHGGRTCTGVLVRVLQRLLVLTAAIWHNDQTGQTALAGQPPASRVTNLSRQDS